MTPVALQKKDLEQKQMKATKTEAFALMAQGQPAFHDLRPRNQAQWRGQAVERFTGGAEMARNRDGSNWRSENSDRLTKMCQ